MKILEIVLKSDLGQLLQDLLDLNSHKHDKLNEQLLFLYYRAYKEGSNYVHPGDQVGHPADKVRYLMRKSLSACLSQEQTNLHLPAYFYE